MSKKKSRVCKVPVIMQMEALDLNEDEWCLDAYA